MTKSRPNFDPDHKDVYPIEDVGDERILIHCGVHQQAFPREGEDDTPEMQKVRADIEALCHSFNIKVGNISTGLCGTCFHEEMKKIDDLVVK